MRWPHNCSQIHFIPFKYTANVYRRTADKNLCFLIHTHLEAVFTYLLCDFCRFSWENRNISVEITSKCGWIRNTYIICVLYMQNICSVSKLLHNISTPIQKSTWESFGAYSGVRLRFYVYISFCVSTTTESMKTNNFDILKHFIF